MKRAIVVAAVVLVAAATPALADPNCLASGGSASFRVETGINIGKFTEQEQMQFDVMRARRAVPWICSAVLLLLATPPSMRSEAIRITLNLNRPYSSIKSQRCSVMELTMGRAPPARSGR